MNQLVLKIIIIKELKIGKGGRDMRRAPASVVTACQASTAGEQGRGSLSAQIELATKAAPLSVRTGVLSRAQTTQCAATDRVSGHPVRSALPQRLPGPWQVHLSAESPWREAGGWLGVGPLPTEPEGRQMENLIRKASMGG